jgi:hypothetical protein
MTGRILNKQELIELNKLCAGADFKNRQIILDLLKTIDSMSETIQRSLTDYLDARSELNSLRMRTKQ